MDEDRRGQAQDRGIDEAPAELRLGQRARDSAERGLAGADGGEAAPRPELGGIVTSVALSMRLNAVLSAFRTSMPSPVPTTASSEPKASTG